MRNPFKALSKSTDVLEPEPVTVDQHPQPSSSEGEKGKPKVDISQAAADLSKIEHAHQWDPNLPQAQLDAFKKAVASGDAEEIAKAEALFTDDSPYEEVRAAVRNTDGGEVANTVRAWILGMIFVTLGSGVNMFLSMRSPAISFPSVVVQLLVYPVGCLWARVVPTKVFSTFGVKWTFNTGPFNIKEHVVITLMANVSIGYAYSTDALLALQGKPFYNINLGWGFALLFTLSSQLIGISFAGMFRRFLVWPSAMIWPSVFSNTALFHALHDKTKSDNADANGWGISRYRYFFYVLCGMFCYYWLPGVIFQGMQVFAFVTWISPNNVVLNQLFGGITGLSLIPITFDWTYVNAYLGDPLLAPVHTHINTLVGLFVFVILSTIGIVYSGAIYSEYVPLVTSQTYDNTQSKYNVSRILGDGFTFDLAKYKEYSPLYLSPTLALNYGMSFAALTAALVHTGLFHGKEIWYRLKTARNQEPDVHLKMMRKYVDAPDWWYVVLFVITMALGLGTCLGYDSQIPWWAFFVSVIMVLVFVIPTCTILAISNIALALNVLSPFLAGFMIPGRPIGVMIFKVYSTIVLGQAQTYSADLKMAHYMKIPPKTTFWCQVVATIWATFVQISVMNWTLGNIPGCCDTDQPARFTCPNGRAFFSSSIVWGVIGPQRMFGSGSMYANFNYFWLIGAVLPLILWVLIRKLNVKFARHFNAPIMLGAMGWLPPATPLSFWSWGMYGLLFNHFIRKRWGGWWHTYNFVTAAGLDAGLIISTIVVFFAITLPDVTIPQWWGNVDVYNTMDSSFTAVLRTVPEGGTFGPATW
ncbi:OPT family small oligopeptide transporter [Pseudomassariella vexata]|uniref:OPT family small oligopeptide transporter n=1 Tax=Pseudomassariella vexata TaxID=1141098 RepID=A0A1Y2DSY0_9PEZI|nr:OPT family small oligopeptide transporter [Pseudomassariella vexata]ORY61765.1 OPT family small oligopeptide transporter [Pseudomassariella vexata]